MWCQKLHMYWDKKTPFCLFLANPYCSEDAFGYYAFQDLKNVSSQLYKTLNLFFSYNVTIEDFLTQILLQKEKTPVILLIDTIQSICKDAEPIPIFHKDKIILPTISTHKAEWSIVAQFCKTYKIELAILLIPIKDTTFRGEIVPLPKELTLLKNRLIECFLKFHKKS